MNGILLSAIIENITTRKDRSIKITIGTQEVSEGKAGALFSLLNSLAVVYISSQDIPQDEIEKVDKIDPELGGKTQSQRIRNVLFKLYEQDAEGHANFDNYYHAKTELYINHLKNKIL